VLFSTVAPGLPALFISECAHQSGWQQWGSAFAH